MNYKITQVDPDFSGFNYFSLIKLLRSSWITEGKYTNSLALSLLKETGAQYGVFAPNGTLSLTLSLLATGLKPGGKVLVPDTTFFGTASAVILAGGIPVPAPVDSEYFLIDHSCLEKFIDDKTTHLMPVDIFGYAYNRDALNNIAKIYNLKIVEDSAQALGVRYKNTPVGADSLASSFSFFADKTITMGEGGFITTNNIDVYNSLLLYRNQGRLNRGSFIHEEIGYNFRITDVQAYIGLSQIVNFQKIINRKLSNLALYKDYLSDNSKIKVVVSPSYSTHIPFRLVVILDNLEKAIKKLEENHIQTRRFFYPIHKQPGLIKWYQNNGLQMPDTKNYTSSIFGYEHGLLLPIHGNLKKSEIKKISLILNEVA